MVSQRLLAPDAAPGIFGSRQFVAANTVTFAVYAALSGLLFLLVVELQVALGYPRPSRGWRRCP